MRLRVFVGLLSIVLTACTDSAATIDPLPSSEVLSKAAKATQTLESAEYTLTGKVNATNGPLWTVGAQLRMDGILKDAGKQMRFQMDADATIDDAEGEYVVDGTLEVIVASDTEVFMNLHSLKVQPPNPVLRPDLVGKLASKWWLLPQDDSLPASQNVTPDPRLLHAQSQVVKITEDNGIKKHNGRQVYHYNVELDKQKLMTYMKQLAQNDPSVDVEGFNENMKDVLAKGELWIDAQTFYVHKLKWNVDSYPIPNGGSAALQFAVDFRDHNSAPDIIPPTDAKPFSPYELLSFPDDSFIDTSSLTDEEPALDDETIQSLLRSMDSY